jgi:HK97 family phage prohead protease
MPQNEHTNTFHFVASTGDADRNGNVLDLDGWDLANYRANPVVLFNHNWDLPPVGRTSRLYTEGNRLLAQVEFAPTPLGQELALLNADGYLRAISVGARPLEWEIRRHPEHGFPIGIHSHRHELLELSIVAIPANPATVRAALQTDCQDPKCPVHHADQAPYCAYGPNQPDLPQGAILSYLANPRPAEASASADLQAFRAIDRSQGIVERLQAINARLRR